MAAEKAVPSATAGKRACAQNSNPNEVGKRPRKKGGLAPQPVGGNHLSVTAKIYIRNAKSIVEDIASRISDPKMRESYLSKPEHRELFKEEERI